MSNPFDNDDLQFSVVVNDEGQHALWPNLRSVPAGWQKVFGLATRQECLDHVEARWTDLRPASLVAKARSVDASA